MTSYAPGAYARGFFHSIGLIETGRGLPSGLFCLKEFEDNLC
jgi:hypothetical protein